MIEILKKIREDFQKPGFIGCDPNDFDRGLGLALWLLACFFIIVLIPVWGPIFALGFIA